MGVSHPLTLDGLLLHSPCGELRRLVLLHALSSFQRTEPASAASQLRRVNPASLEQPASFPITDRIPANAARHFARFRGTFQGYYRSPTPSTLLSVPTFGMFGLAEVFASHSIARHSRTSSALRAGGPSGEPSNLTIDLLPCQPWPTAAQLCTSLRPD